MNSLDEVKSIIVSESESSTTKGCGFDTLSYSLEGEEEAQMDNDFDDTSSTTSSSLVSSVSMRAQELKEGKESGASVISAATNEDLVTIPQYCRGGGDSGLAKTYHNIPQGITADIVFMFVDDMSAAERHQDAYAEEDSYYPGLYATTIQQAKRRRRFIQQEGFCMEVD